MFSLNPNPFQFLLKTGGSYSRFVNCMRVLLPIIAILIMLAIIIWPKLQDDPKKFRLGISKNILGENTLQELVNPRYTGLDKNKQPFSITASSASPKEGSLNQINLSSPKADFSMADNGWIVLSAANGIYDLAKEELELEGVVNVFHDAGHEIKTSDVKIDFKKNIAYSKKQLEGQGPIGNIVAKSLLIKGGEYFFKGPASVIIEPDLIKK